METQEQLICEQRWYDNNQLRSEEYWLNGKRHNEAGPAYCIWHQNGQLETEQYWLNNHLHNESGPAYCFWYENGQLGSEQYWLDYEHLTKEEWEKRVNGCNPVGKTVEIDGVTYRLERAE